MMGAMPSNPGLGLLSQDRLYPLPRMMKDATSIKHEQPLDSGNSSSRNADSSILSFRTAREAVWIDRQQSGRTPRAFHTAMRRRSSAASIWARHCVVSVAIFSPVKRRVHGDVTRLGMCVSQSVGAPDARAQRPARRMPIARMAARS